MTITTLNFYGASLTLLSIIDSFRKIADMLRARLVALAALAVVRPDWRAGLLAALDPALDAVIMQATVFDGPAVDGVTTLQAMTVDGLPVARHHAKLEAIRAAAG